MNGRNEEKYASIIQKRAMWWASVDVGGKEDSSSSGFWVRNQMDVDPLASVTVGTDLTTSSK